MKTLSNVDWQITSLCNRNCSYCFGPKNIASLSLSDIYKIIEALVGYGTKQIGITGGEPLLHPFFSEIINYIYNAGLTTYLSTNCDLYDQYSNIIKSKVSIIGIPIDGSCADLHDIQRGKGSFHNVMNTLRDINNSDCLTKVKIGTVITNRNASDLESIEKILSEYNDCILYWKLYQLVSYDRNIDKVNKLKPGAVNNDNLGTFLGKEKIVFDTLSMRNRSYFFIKPNGDVFIPFLMDICSKEVNIGNMINDNIDNILNRFFTLVNSEGYLSVFRYMKT